MPPVGEEPGQPLAQQDRVLRDHHPHLVLHRIRSLQTHVPRPRSSRSTPTAAASCPGGPYSIPGNAVARRRAAGTVDGRGIVDNFLARTGETGPDRHPPRVGGERRGEERPERTITQSDMTGGGGCGGSEELGGYGGEVVGVGAAGGGEAGERGAPPTGPVVSSPATGPPP
ncbi:hypothetical protein MTP06_23360 [Streptomyces sp. PLM4]|nr:hypothetical protein MTP06_23360 [Streptomyces sp. PLM4]